MTAVCTYPIRRMSSLCFDSQYETEEDWMDESQVTVYCVGMSQLKVTDKGK